MMDGGVLGGVKYIMLGAVVLLVQRSDTYVFKCKLQTVMFVCRKKESEVT